MSATGPQAGLTVLRPPATARRPPTAQTCRYQYFCQQCSESGRFCHNANFRLPGVEPCPSMPFVDFVRMLGNVFTRDLSRASACAKCPATPGSGEANYEHFKVCASASTPCALTCKPYEETCGPLQHVADNDKELALAKA